MQVVKTCSSFCARLFGVVCLTAAIFGLGAVTFSYLSGDIHDRAEIESSLKSIVG
ncbi:MAG: hypothetical protein V4692_14455 [Bdellovibrionota bacterium]